MIEPEAFQLLTLASARDNRSVTPEVAAVWAEDLHDVTAEEGKAAMQAHYREKPDAWLMPGHIVEQVMRRRRERQRAGRAVVRASERRAVESTRESLADTLGGLTISEWCARYRAEQEASGE